MIVTNDVDAWQAYPLHRQWFNKLWLSQHLGYSCGPGGVPVPVAGDYVVRPIMNLYGMGAGATFRYLTPADADTVPPGYFWNKKIEGEHLSVELFWHSARWQVQTCWAASRPEGAPVYEFEKWQRVERKVKLPRLLDTVWDCGHINVEMIAGKIVEVHLRATPDPTGYDELITVWDHDSIEKFCKYNGTHEFVPSEDYVYGTEVRRIGFWCR